ncbi:MAG TPA: hypothetical protein VIX39_10290, partial [Actinomycetota bacterium]
PAALERGAHWAAAACGHRGGWLHAPAGGLGGRRRATADLDGARTCTTHDRADATPPRHAASA